jgi:uncharacterized membrane protein YoaK (UPF0700 family)
MKKFFIAALLSFNSGCVDSIGFFGLQGLFAAHVTGNFVTMGSTVVFGMHGIIGKVLVLPEFVGVVALTRLAGLVLIARQKPVLRMLLSLDLLFLFGFFITAILYEPFPDADTPKALVTSFMAVAAMAMLNAVQRIHLKDMPPITIMTGNTTQVSIDAVDLIRERDPEKRAILRTRFLRFLNSIVFFATGCATGIILYFHIGFWSLILSVVAGLACIVLCDD